jgi:uncharacterized repeat protein (TIGR02543 family)
MIGQTSGNSLRRRRAGRLAGALGLLLALALIGGGVLPVYAQGPIPVPPEAFAGTVSTLTPAGLVPQGTLVQAFVDGTKKAETTTDAEGKYFLMVEGPGTTVTFKVAGVTAHESTTWESGEIDYNFNLTIDSLSGVNYALTMAVAPNATGTATDVTHASPYAAGIVVSIKAVPATGYHFSHWTAVPAVVFGNANAASTTFTMPAADVTVTANFAVGAAYTLTMAASPFVGGTATDVTGASPYTEGTVVSIQAVPASEYQFVGWTATAGAFGNANAASTAFTMPAADVTVTATFQVSSTGGLCFIATAAYGSPTAEQLDVLREFRDVVLLPSSLGADFVSLYYKISPPIAEVISRHDFLRTVVRVSFLDPIVAILNWSYALWSERG